MEPDDHGTTEWFTAQGRIHAAAAARRGDTAELYQHAISGAGAVPYAYDFRTQTYEFMGAGIEDLIGYKAEEVTPALWVEIIQESVMLGETAGLAKAEAARRIKAGQINQWRCDMRVLTRAGKSRWISDASVQHLDETGKPFGAIGILQDISERKQAETSAQAFSKLGQELLGTNTLEAAARMVVRVADELFGWDACNLFLYLPESDELFTVLEVDTINRVRQDTAPLGSRLKPSPTSLRILKQGAELILRDGKTMEPDAHPYGDVGRPSASIMRVPIRQRGRPTGVIALHSYAVGAYTKNDLNILQTLADYCSGAFERIWADENAGKLNRQLLDASRQAGMAEIATSVLHNVGNVLNSVNVSASLISEKLRDSKVQNLAKASAMLQAHRANLGSYLNDDPKGRALPDYLARLAEHLLDEQGRLLAEVSSLSKDIDHIKEIVAMQQNYARVSGLAESLNVIELVEDAVRLNEGAIGRQQIRVVRDYHGIAFAEVEKHKVLQIMVNLIGNACHAVGPNPPGTGVVTIRVKSSEERVEILVADNGVGITRENLTRIFEHGFTTRKDGHGFGLHSGANAAREMGGALTVQSGGAGQGATFTLELPVRSPSAERN